VGLSKEGCLLNNSVLVFYWLLVTCLKILGMNRGFGNLGVYHRKSAATDQRQETRSQ
jgi:hypothetical protein